MREPTKDEREGIERYVKSISKDTDINFYKNITGHWKFITDGYVEFYECSECGRISSRKESYCPKCGLKMDVL